MRTFQDLQGKEVTLGRFLGRGGEGAVYSVPMRPGLVAKIYARTPDDHMGRKLAAMVQLGTEPLTTLAAWPQDLLLDERTGNVVGFLMPRVEDHRGIHALYGPKTRKMVFPDATWAFLARTARNVAATFDTVHGHGHVIGDVNEGNIVVSQKATVRLIDCDSFQITHLGRTYPCRVGVPLYTPPELQGKRLEDVVRTPDHDRFGLAVLIFQLLFMGRHPFGGLHPERAIPVGMAIREGLFAFGREAARQAWEPPPFSLRLTDVSSSVAQLFEQAFGKDAAAGGPRPTAAEWVTVLGDLETKAVICSNDPRHVGVNGSCPWCRIEKEGGPSFFLRAEPRREILKAAIRDQAQVLVLGGKARSDEVLTPTEAFILSRVDGKLTAEEVIQLVPQNREEAERSLLGLLLTGIVEFAEGTARPAAPARFEPQRREIQEAYQGLAWKNHFEVLGVLEGATEGEIKRAYFQQVKKFHPDKYHDSAFADIADRIEAVFMRIGGAYEVLHDSESRRSYEEVLKRRRGTKNLPVRPAAGQPEPDEIRENQIIDTAENAWMAEEAIHRAARLIGEEKVWEAIQLLQAIIPRIYGRKQRDRARVLLARAYMKNPNWVRRGEELLLTIIQEDPENAEAHKVLGMLYKESGMSSRAAKLFKKAEELKPRNRANVPPADPVEQELLMRLGGLMVKTRSSFQALEDKLTADERDQVLNAMDRFKTITAGGVDELRRCVEELERVLRLLESVRSRG